MAAAPVAGVWVGVLVAWVAVPLSVGEVPVGCEVAGSVGVSSAVDVVVCAVGVVVLAGLAGAAEVGALVDVAVEEDVLVVVAAGGAGAPGLGGSVEVPLPVTSAPFFGDIVTNAEESGACRLANAPDTLPPPSATR
jgi:hypothetical protein